VMAARWGVAMLLLVAAGAWAQTESPAIEPFVALGDAESGWKPDLQGATLERADDALVLRFVAPEDGTWRVGIVLTAPAITPLAPGLREYRAEDLPEPLLLRYPYDWTYAGARNVMNPPRLAWPGVSVGDGVYLVDTHELTAVRLEAAAGQVRALLLAHRYYNDGADAATTDLPLRAGEAVELRVEVHDSLTAARAASFGQPSDVGGTMTQCAYRGWTAVNYAPEQYESIAAALAGHYDRVIVREAETHAWLAPILHAHGVQVLAYQYLGALRRFSAQETEDSEAQIGMIGSGGGRYTAPTSPEGPWLLGDIRRPEVRAVFVARAVAAIEAGFDGLFLDGTNFFADDTGRRGGNVPGAEHSLAWAQWRLLAEIRTAMRAADPDAILGTLGNDPYDALGEADFVVKERMYFGWEPFARDLPDRGTVVSMTYDTAFEAGEAPLMPTRIVYGVKGYSSISVQTALHFVREPTGAWYLGTGDHTPDRLDEWLATIVAHATEDLYVTAIEPPEAVLHFTGRDTVRAAADCRIELSRPACLADAEGRCLAHQVTAAELSGETRYRLLHRCGGE